MAKKKKVKISKTVPKYNTGAQTPGTQIDPTTGLPMKPQVPYGMLGQFAGGAVDAFGEDDPTKKEYMATKGISGGLRGAGIGAQLGTTIGGPGVGTAIGAGTGLLAGTALSLINAKQNTKDAEEEEKAAMWANSQETFKNKEDFFDLGGKISNPLIEVEGPELEVSKGKILKNFKGQPSHMNGGYQYNAKPGRVIIRGKDAEKYKNSDQFTRNSMEREHVLTQKINGQNTEEYKRGGRINFRSVQGYQDWLQYMRVTGVRGNTPGYKPKAVWVRGKKTIPKFDGGGLTYDKWGNPVIRQDWGQTGHIPLREIDINGKQVQMWAPESKEPRTSQLQSLGIGYDGFLNSETQYNPNIASQIAKDTKIMEQEFPTNKNSGTSTTPSGTSPGLRFPNTVNQASVPQDFQMKNPGVWNQPAQGTSPVNPEGKTFNPQKFGLDAAIWAPAAYNAFMAFQKPAKEAPIYNPHESQALGLYKKRISYDPTLRAIENTGRNVRKAYSTTGGMSQGELGSFYAQNAANEMAAKATGIYNIDRANQASDITEAGALDTFGQQRRAANAQARQTDLGVLQNQAQYLPKALEETSFLAQKFNQQELMGNAYKKYYQSLAEIQPDLPADVKAKKKKEADDNLAQELQWGYRSNQGYNSRNSAF